MSDRKRRQRRKQEHGAAALLEQVRLQSAGTSKTATPPVPETLAAPVAIRTSTLRLRRLTVTGSGAPVPRVIHMRSTPPGHVWHLPCDLVQTDAESHVWTACCTLPLAAFAEGIERLDLHCDDEYGVQVLGLPVGRAIAVGAAEHLRNGRLEGWFSRLSADAETSMSSLQLCVDGRPVQALCERITHADIAEIDFGTAGGGFSFRLPPGVFDGRERSLSVRARDTVLPGEWRYKTQWIGHVDYFDGTRLIGWIADRHLGVDPNGYQLVTKDGVLLSFAATDERKDIADNGGPLHCGFALDLPTRLDVRIDDPRIVHAQVPSHVVFGPESFLDTRGHIGTARDLINRLDSGSQLDEQDRWWLKRLCAETLADLRRTDRRLGHAHRFPRPATPAVSDHSRHTTVLIPVYEGYDDTVACLRSVHEAVRKEPGCRVVVIDDCSPDRRLAHELPQLCRRYGFQLLKNSENRGFVASVNYGVSSFPNDDIVLLNSDTIVPHRFVSRMRSHLRDRKIASVTAMSNNATILSYPRMNVQNAMPAIDNVLELDAIFDKTNRGRSLDIPTAIGFCMLLRRDAIDSVGLFDAIWDKGYCEENDWCIRASDQGYRHVAACDVFVGHVGGVSFGAERLAHVEKNFGMLLRRYPEYQAEVHDFIARDPVSDIRRRVDLEILRRDSRPKVLLISIALGGGIERFVHDQALHLKSEGVYPLILRASQDDRFTLSTSVSVEMEDGHQFTVRNEDIRSTFQRDLMPLISRVHLHTLAGIPVEVLDILREFPVEKHFMAHDYAAVCPRVTLLQGDLTFCDLPPVAVCEGCVERDGAHAALPGFLEKFGGVESWRAYVDTLLATMTTCTAPSRDLAHRLARVLPVAIGVSRPEENVSYFDYRSRPTRKAKDRVRLLVVGAIGAHKGLGMLKAIASHIQSADLPIELVVIGYTSEDPYFRTMPFVTITGRYESKDAVSAILAAQGHCALFLSPWPETWSYTLSEVFVAGVPVVAIDLGAIGERVRDAGAGFLVPATATAEDICRLVIDEFVDRPGKASADKPASAPRKRPMPCAAGRPSRSTGLEYAGPRRKAEG